MKRKTILFAGLIAGFSLSAQNADKKHDPTKLADYMREAHAESPVLNHSSEKNKSGAALIWSEDFSGGIPSTWSNVGITHTGATATIHPWEYRGPATTPSNAVGSRGAYAGSQQPIASATASNGFVIFDSDYLDSNGDPATMGTGAMITPHIGKLTTPVIDLTGHPYVELSFTNYARRFQAGFFVAISTDGGVTFPDSVEFFNDVDLPVNSATARNAVASANLSCHIGGVSNVVLQFVFDGTRSNVNGSGYYFWMIDDIELRDVPANELRFTALATAPIHDVIVTSSTSPKMGTQQLEQAQPVTFDSNIWNYGYEDQTNVRLEVEIYDDNDNLVTTLTSPSATVVASCDTVDFNTFTTSSSWTPSAIGNYNIVYALSSDSISAANGPRDTIPYIVTHDVSALDYGVISDFVGSSDIGDDGRMAVKMYFPNGNNAGEMAVFGFDIGISPGGTAAGTTTLAGGNLQIDVYDAAGFDDQLPAPSVFTTPSLYTAIYPVTTNMIGNVVRLPILDPLTGDTIPSLTLDAAGKAYYVEVTLLTNNGTYPIHFNDDQTIDQNLSSVMFYAIDGNYYSGFTSGLMNAPWIRMATSISVGLDDSQYNNNLSVFPNPTSGNVKIRIPEGGKYQLEVLSISGQRVSYEEITVNGGEDISRDFSSFERGMYLVNLIDKEGIIRSSRISIK